MVTKDQVVEVLKRVNDPEIMHNVYDLGLIYAIEVESPGLVKIKMTLTTPFCPYGPELIEEIKRTVKKDLPAVATVEIETVWEPPWDLDKIDPEIRAQLGMF